MQEKQDEIDGFLEAIWRLAVAAGQGAIIQEAEKARALMGERRGRELTGRAKRQMEIRRSLHDWNQRDYAEGAKLLAAYDAIPEEEYDRRWAAYRALVEYQEMSAWALRARLGVRYCPLSR